MATALWIAAAAGNRGELFLFNHVTDWIWVRYGGLSLFTNLAGLMPLAAAAIFIFGTVVETGSRRREEAPKIDESGLDAPP